MSTEGFDEIYRTEFASLERVAFVVTGSSHDAEQIVQEAFARFYARLDKLMEYENPAGWLYSVVVRLAVRERDGAARHAALRVDPVDTNSASWHVEDADLLSAIRDLPDNQRIAIALRYYADFTTRAVAKELGCRPSTARVHLHRGRKSLANSLTQKEQRDA